MEFEIFLFFCIFLRLHYENVRYYLSMFHIDFRIVNQLIQGQDLNEIPRNLHKFTVVAFRELINFQCLFHFFENHYLL
jgi:hypothetical protein